MREIKFRLWNESEKYMSDPLSIYKMVDSYDMIAPEAIMMQLTGRQDNNGKEIWEGDLVLAFFDNTKCLVVYDPDRTAFMLRNIKDGALYFLSVTDKVEVIGNIYENPELLVKEE